MRIVELFEIGFFTAFWNWKVPFLTAAIYFFVFMGAAFQIILQKKCCIPKMEWFLITICAISINDERCQADTSGLRELLDKTYDDVMSGVID